MNKENLSATAVAHSNIALIKYWGKRNPDLNLPVVGSISVTLSELLTRTRVRFTGDIEGDILYINDKNAGEKKTKRVSNFLNIVRKMAGIKEKAEVHSTNSFLTGAGLASSASAFAALSLAATKAAGLSLDKSQLSVLARQGSGSAARSIYGGFVEMKTGQQADGLDTFAVQLAPPSHWDLRLIIAITSIEEKEVSSTIGMQRTAQTSPYYAGWVCSTHHDLTEMRTAILNRDFQRVGELAEHSSLKMHALAMSARPAVIYWNQITMHLICEIYDMRKNGIQVYFTIDAGPQVKIICNPDDVESVKNRIAQIPGVSQIIHTSLGPDAYLEN